VAAAAVVRGVIGATARGAALAVVPTVLELGDHEHGNIAIGRFGVRNAGTGDLVLDQFRSSCACAAVEVERDGESRRAGVVVVKPGEEVELVARVAVGGRPGTAQRVYVSFATNDPRAAQATVELVVGRIKGGVATVPLAVVFGEQPVGSRLGQRVRVYDNGVTGRRIGAVRSLNPGRFSATLVSPTDEDAREAVEAQGSLIGVVEVTPIAGRAGPLDGRVEIQVADEPRSPDYINVHGELVGAVVTRPDRLVLPRAVGGKFVYEGRVSVSSRDGKPVTVTPDAAPSGWSVRAADAATVPDVQTVVVSCSSATPPRKERFDVRLRVSLAGGGVEVVEIPVLLRGDEP
jgi:hypothetical protein